MQSINRPGDLVGEFKKSRKKCFILLSLLQANGIKFLLHSLNSLHAVCLVFEVTFSFFFS